MNVDAFLEKLWQLDKRLQEKGFKPISEWWRSTIEDAYKSGVPRIVIRKGRRVGASTIVAPRLAVAEALFGEHDFAPGEEYDVIFLSVRKDEAQKRIRNIISVLDALGVPYNMVDGFPRLKDRPVGFKVLAAKYKTVVGDTAIFCWADENSRWNDEEWGANPAVEVIASVAPALATQPNAKLWLVSSPLGTLDYHATQFALGNTDNQRVYFGSTWEINPTLTEDATHRLESDPRRWAREYQAIPQGSALGAFETESVDAAFAKQVCEDDIAGEPVLVIDPSSGRKDTWSFCIAQYRTPPVRYPELPFGAIHIVRKEHTQSTIYQHGLPMLCDDVAEVHYCELNGNRERIEAIQDAPYIHLYDIAGIEGSFYKNMSADQLVRHVSRLAKRKGCRYVHSDQRDAYTLGSMFSAHGMKLIEHPYSNVSKPEGVSHVRGWFRDGRVALEPHEKLRKELLGFEERILPSGSISFGARGSGHDDYVSLLITTALADLNGDLKTSPYRRSSARREITGQELQDRMRL